MKRKIPLFFGVCLVAVFAAFLAGRIVAGEAVITGKVTPDGTLKSDHGPEYLVAGEKTEELDQNTGKQVKVRGTVQAEPGKVLVDVKEYKFMKFQETMTAEAAQDDDTFVSCTDWVNCNSWSPTYTGTCCRYCRDTQGEKRWDCQVFSVGEHFDVAEW